MNDLGHLPLGSLMGGALSPLTDAEIAITSAIALTQASIGRMHVCSGTSAAYTVGLPDVDGNTGKFIGFRMSSALTQLVTLQGNNSQNIDGQNTRVMWANESAILYCDGVAWTKILGKTIPMHAVMKRTTAQSIPASATTQIVMNATVSDNTGVMADTTNGRVNIKRAGFYHCSGFGSLESVTGGVAVQGGVYRNNTIEDGPNGSSQGSAPSAGGGVGYCAMLAATLFNCAAGDNLSAYIYQAETSASRNTRTVATVLPTLEVTEIVSW